MPDQENPPAITSPFNREPVIVAPNPKNPPPPIYHAPDVSSAALAKEEGTTGASPPLGSQESKSNFFSLEHYSKILAGEKGFKSFLVILLFSLLVSIKPSIYFFQVGYPFIKNLEGKLTSLVNEIYPKDLEITIKDGIASSNVTEPYYVTISQDRLENVFSTSETKSQQSSKIRLLAIDTKGKAEDFERYQSLALLTQTSLTTYKDNNINIYPLRNIQDFTINKTLIDTTLKDLNKDNRIVKFLVPLIYLGPVLIFLLSIIYVYNKFFLLAIGVYIMAKLNNVDTNYGKTFRYTVAVSFIPVMALEGLTYLLPQVPNISTPITLVLCYLGINYLIKERRMQNFR